ncbi:beta-phosphoglucomutase [Texcoconibacillus texcoconensis]|uniref:Beta-phosphoglucomutase n=1 Tax=Texcoconibacillus texcoconensis TaxID=1095777 RepID=A0A840QQK5_9BACI|nr:beta-phosphoglucomutase [Texcoconibacillus texcoconensis]MBB5173722.1 beta-phosphoglucomutase [Texcoconibacillus texcoconensis]
MNLLFEAVIFDLDGVLADTVGDHYLATKRVADEEGLHFNREMNQKVQGMSRRFLIEQLVKNSQYKYSDVEKEKLGERKNQYYKERIAGLSKEDLLPGMHSFLIQLKQHNIKLAIASSSSNAKLTLTNLEIIDFFDVIIDPRSVQNMKPDPEIFIKAADELEVSGEKCVAIEDGEAGMQAIKQTSMFSVGIGDHTALKKANWHVKNTSEITLEKLASKVNHAQAN